MKSVYEYIIFHRRNPIAWNTNKQKTVAISSTAAEILAVSENLDTFIIPRDILSEIFEETIIVALYEDNTSATFMIDGCQNKSCATFSSMLLQSAKQSIPRS